MSTSIRRLLCSILVLLGSCVGPLLHTTDYDVVVYGGTSAGVVAAIQAARMGHSVVIVEPGAHVGGMTSAGICAHADANEAAIGGITREFYRRIRAHYAQDSAWRHEAREKYRGRGHGTGDAAWTFEPHVAEQVFREMLAEARVPVLHGERLDLERGLRMSGRRILAIRLESGREVTGRMFLDCSYEGDLLAEAGVGYRVGREANREHGETHNGVQAAASLAHQFRSPVDSFRVERDPESGLLPGIESTVTASDGSADAGVQAAGFRLCVTDHEPNRIAWRKPADYDPARYELLLRLLRSDPHELPWELVPLPNRKFELRSRGPVSVDLVGASWRFPDGGWAERAAITTEHERWTRGLLWTLANDPRVPADLRAEVQRFGLARDEFTDGDSWPHRLHLRCGRRMVGLETMTELHCTGGRGAERAIGLAWGAIEPMPVRCHVAPDGSARTEGGIRVAGFDPYPVGYGSIVPRREECVNLLVPVCLSATHVAQTSLQREPILMVLGQSAAAAACLAAQAGRDVQDVRYSVLQQQLTADHQVLRIDPR